MQGAKDEGGARVAKGEASKTTLVTNTVRFARHRNPYFSMNTAKQKAQFSQQSANLLQKFQWLDAASQKLDDHLSANSGQGKSPAFGLGPQAGKGEATAEVTPDTPIRSIFKRSASSADLDKVRHSPKQKKADTQGVDAMALLGFMKTVTSAESKKDGSDSDTDSAKKPDAVKFKD